jgi:hypothetical protein
MSNRSRARFRADHDHHAPAEPESPADEQLAADVEDMVTAFDKGDQKAGISKWAGLILRDRENALAEPAAPAPKPEAVRYSFGADPLREPTPFEAAVLFALGNRTTVIEGRATNKRGRVIRPPVEVPVSVMSGGIYGGTVEPERVAARRRRNKAARAARSGNRRRTYGHVYRPKFGWPVNVPGITPGIDIHGNVDAEVVDA